jgi:hypothetical protein
MFHRHETQQHDPDELSPAEDTSRNYRAFRGKRMGGSRVISVQFVPNRGTHNRRIAMHLYQISDCRKDGREVAIEFSTGTVVLSGRNLAAVDDGIGAGWIAYVEAFDPRIRDMPGDDAPFIERIDFFLPPGERTKAKPKHEPETEVREHEPA